MATIHNLIPQHDLKVVPRATTSLTPNPRNSRTHPQRQLRKLCEAIGQFGFVAPILIDTQGMILCGHARWAVAQKLGLETVPTVTIAGLSPAEVLIHLRENSADPNGQAGILPPARLQ